MSLVPLLACRPAGGRPLVSPLDHPGRQVPKSSGSRVTQPSSLPELRLSALRLQRNRAVWDAEEVRLSTTIDESMESSSSTPVMDSSMLSTEALAEHIRILVYELGDMKSYASKLDILLRREAVGAFLGQGVGRQVNAVVQAYAAKDNEEDYRRAYCLVCLLEIGQKHVLCGLVEGRLVNGAYQAALEQLACSLEGVEEFYDSIGGIAGYQMTALGIMLETDAGEVADGRGNAVEMLVPEGLDIRSEEAKSSILEGIKAMDRIAEIYPLGGAGDRLGLQCEETGDSLPTAVLPYCGRSLLEHLVRDVQGREYLHFRLFGGHNGVGGGLHEGKSVPRRRTPIAVMTSMAKGNHNRVMQLFQANNWFGRGSESFKMFQQPMVPMVRAEDGRWALGGPCEVVMKPGGHGVIWKLMLDNGVFDWLEECNARSAIVRQISNPMAGQDSTLLALSGAGVLGDKAFGFASCERVVGAAEGMNVMLRETDTTGKTTCRISNVEYTEFTKHGIEDKAVDGSNHSLFPANTNVLYLGLEHVKRKVEQSVREGTTEAILPGMILNLNKSIGNVNVETGIEECAPAGRLECTMQNLADCFKVDATILDDARASGESNDQDLGHALETFLVYGPRSKVTSSAKRKRAPGSLKIHQTPDGSFYDLQKNAKAMLEGCGMSVPDVGSVAEYLERGPGFICLFHPALGPLWDVVAQKIAGGRLHAGAEIQLEIAEASLTNVNVDGSLLVIADAVMGVPSDDGTLEYSSDTCARIMLEDVTVQNAGIDYKNPHNVFWRHRVKRHEACRIELLGRSEFDAAGVVLKGNQKFVVPDGHRMTVRATEDAARLDITVEPLDIVPTWSYHYMLASENGVESVLLTKRN